VKGQWLLATAAIAVSAISTVSADSAAFQQKVLATEGLLGSWAFEDNLADGTKNANDGKVKGEASMVTFGPGVNGGRALKIDNSTPGQMVEVNSPIGSIFDTPKTTVAAWAMVSQAEEGLWNSIIDRNSLWYLSTENVFADRPGHIDLVVRIYDPANPTGGGDRVRDENAFARVNEWHFYAFTYDGNEVVAYLDGKEVARLEQTQGIGPTADTPAESPHENYNLTWGAWQQRDDWFTGLIDDSAVFNRDLTADEIKGLYEAMLAKPVEPAPTAGG
jgi:hypothetical protein